MTATAAARSDGIPKRPSNIMVYVLPVVNLLPSVSWRVSKHWLIAVRVPNPKRWRPYQNIIALPSLIAEAKEVGSASKTVQEAYMNILNKLGNEFYILLDCPIAQIKEAAGDVLAEGVNRMRQGKVEIAAGYDGEFGTIKIFESGEREHIEKQMALF